MVAHDFNPSTWEAEEGGSLWVQGYPILQSKFQDKYQSYTENLLVEKPKAKKKKNKLTV